MKQAREVVMGSCLQQLKRYGVVGVFNTVVGYILIFVLMWASAPPLVANATAYAIGLVISFYLNRRWVFAASGRLSAQAVRFLFSFMISFLLNYLVLNAALAAQFNPYVAQIMAATSYSVLFFFLSRHFVFRDDAL